MFPLRVVTQHPHRHPMARALRPAVVLVGGLLYAVGLGATTCVVALGFYLAAWQFGSDRDPTELPLDPESLLALWLAAAVTMVAGLRYGRRLVLGRRGTVLYLRRFRDDASTAAVTAAARRSLGSGWRIVSLDDERLAPVGLSGATNALFSAGRTAARVPRVIVAVWQRAMQVAVLAALLAGALLYRESGWEALLTPFDLDAMTGFPLIPRPTQELGWDPPSVFFVAVTAFFLLGQSTIVALVLMLGMLVLMPFYVAVSSWSQAETWTRTNLRLRATTLPEVEQALTVLAQARKKVLAPRLIVLTVATPIWQETVRRLAARADACLVDVSEPSENVLWELGHLRGLPGARWHAIGEEPDLERLARAAADGSDPAATRLAELLGGRVVLAYGRGRPAVRQFARELRLTMDCRRTGPSAESIPTAR